MPTPVDSTGTSNCGADGLGQGIYDVLKADFSFNVPKPDLTLAEYALPAHTGILYADPTKLANADLTTGEVGGVGTFDQILKSAYTHLRTEFDNGRITGDQYAKAYIEMYQASLGGAVQYLIGRDQAYWGAIVAQHQARKLEIEALTAGVELSTAKAELGIKLVEFQDAQAQYGLTKMKLATEDANFCHVKAQTSQVQYMVSTMLPAQKIGVDHDNTTKAYTNTDMLPTQKANTLADTAVKNYQVTDLLPAQKLMTTEQTNQARAQTLNTRLDGATVAGTMGKQRELYTQQIDSYVKDAQYKAAKMFLDSWITQKTIDEGTAAPDVLFNESINQVMNTIKTTNTLGDAVPYTVPTA